MNGPEGVFEMVNPKANIEISGGGDFNLMVDPNDPNQVAYLAYDAWGNNHAIVIERLIDDYTDSLGMGFSTFIAGKKCNIAFIFGVDAFKNLRKRISKKFRKIIDYKY